MEGIVAFLATVLYVLSSAGFIASEYKQARTASRAALGLAIVGVFFHLVYLFIRIESLKALVFSSVKDAISLFTLLFVALFLFFRLKYSRSLMGMFVMPVATFFMICSLFIPEYLIPANPALENIWILFHLITIFIAYAFFAVAFCVSLMYVLQERMIKRKTIGKLVASMPDLESLDRINHMCVVIGFPFMTVGLFAGFSAAKFFWHRSWSGDPKEIFSLLTWVLYAILFHERLAVGWRGRRASWFAIYGFLCVIITFLGVNLLMSGHHTTFTGK